MVVEQVDGLGTFEIHENYAIGRIDQGVDVNVQHITALSMGIRKHFSGRPIAYISDRVNSYSLCPIAAQKLIIENNVHHVAVVTYTQQQRAVFAVEQVMMRDVPLVSFDSLAQAVDWVEYGLQEHKTASLTPSCQQVP